MTIGGDCCSIHAKLLLIVSPSCLYNKKKLQEMSFEEKKDIFVNLNLKLKRTYHKLIINPNGTGLLDVA